MPLAEVLFDFNDRLKSVTQGYGSFDYEMLDYRATDLVKVDILVNGETGRRSRPARPPRQGAAARAALLRAAGRDHPAPAVQDRHPGGDRRPGHRPHHHQRLPQGRHRQVLRRRHHPQAQAAREAEEGQEADEDGGQRRDPPVGVPGGPQDRQGLAGADRGSPIPDTRTALRRWVHSANAAGDRGRIPVRFNRDHLATRRRPLPPCPLLHLGLPLLRLRGAHRRRGAAAGLPGGIEARGGDGTPADPCDFDTVYLGGGTPSSLAPDQLAERLLGAAAARLPGRERRPAPPRGQPGGRHGASVCAWRELGVPSSASASSPSTTPRFLSRPAPQRRRGPRTAFERLREARLRHRFDRPHLRPSPATTPGWWREPARGGGGASARPPVLLPADRPRGHGVRPAAGARRAAEAPIGRSRPSSSG